MQILLQQVWDERLRICSDDKVSGPQGLEDLKKSESSPPPLMFLQLMTDHPLGQRPRREKRIPLL